MIIGDDMANKLYEVNSTNLSKINAKLLYVTNAYFDTDWHSIQHSHPFTELFYLLRGKGEFHVEQDVYNLKEDDLVIVNANIMHTESSKDEEPLEYIVLGIEGVSLLSDSNDYVSFHNYADFKHEILFYIKTLLSEAKNKSEFYDIISQDLLEVLLVNIIRRTNIDLKISDTKKHNHKCAYIQNYIEANFSEDITLDTLCDISYMNKYYLVHSFKKFSGITPIKYLNNRRLKEACFLLKTTDHSISQISNIIGMSSQSYFAQSFKKEYNLSPLEYRIKHTKQKHDQA